MGALRDHAIALRFAWRTPRVVSADLEGLLASNVVAVTVRATRDIASVRRRAGIALRWLGLLSRAWGPPWRNTCLFRSVTECLVLRAHGYPAHVVIGVARVWDRRRGGDVVEGRSVIAHAWVECEDFVCACGEGERSYHPLLSAAVSG